MNIQPAQLFSSTFGMSQPQGYEPVQTTINPLVAATQEPQQETSQEPATEDFAQALSRMQAAPAPSPEGCGCNVDVYA